MLTSLFKASTITACGFGALQLLSGVKPVSPLAHCHAAAATVKDVTPADISNSTTNGKKIKAVKHSGPEADCPDPVCQSTSDMFAQALKGAALVPHTESSKKVKPGQCPLDVNELGKSAWDVIHTLAAYYPESPSQEQLEAAVVFFQSLALLYPCHICAEDFQASVAKNPPRASSRTELMMWCCDLHNDVNEKLGKSRVPCDLQKLTKMWKTGSTGCAINIDEDDV